MLIENCQFDELYLEIVVSAWVLPAGCQNTFWKNLIALFVDKNVVFVVCQKQVDLPSGGKLSPWGLQLLGLSGLGSSGGFERLHYL